MFSILFSLHNKKKLLCTLIFVISYRKHLRSQNQDSSKFSWNSGHILWLLRNFYVCIGPKDIVIKSFHLSLHDFTYFVLSMWKQFGLRLKGVLCRDQHLTNLFCFIGPCDTWNMYTYKHVFICPPIYHSLTAKYTRWVLLLLWSCCLLIPSMPASLGTQPVNIQGHSYHTTAQCALFIQCLCVETVSLKCYF